MKKIIILILVIVIAIISTFSYIYVTNTAKENNAKTINQFYEQYYEEEIYGNTLASIINKAVDQNETSKIEKDENDNYIENNADSIKIDIQMLDDGELYSMEQFFNYGTNIFVKYYATIMFKCTQIEYHQSTGKIKYMLFEQITE